MNAAQIVWRRSCRLVCGQAKKGSGLAFLKNMNNFVTEFNEKTRAQNGKLVKLKFVFYNNGVLNYEIGQTPSTKLLKNIIGESKKITNQQLIVLTQQVLPDLNTENFDKARNIVMGILRSAHIELSEN